MRPLLLDTDIGSDVDDLYALVMLLKSPQIDLVGVTTVHGNTLLRAKIARYVCQLLGDRSVPITPGEGTPLSAPSAPPEEPVGFPGLESISIDPPASSAPEFLASVAAQRQVEVLAIAPLTNLAIAIRNSQAFAQNIRHIYVMGGAFWSPFLEHNIQVDPEAAIIVFSSGIPITVIGLDVTLQIEITERDLRRLSNSPGRLGPLLEQQTRIWWETLGRQRCHLHDPLATLALTRRDLFEFETGTVKVENTGQTWLQPEAEGRIEVARTVKSGPALELILQTIES
jgi:inosine-uridine nucleoside N-ribohydrolase